VAGYIDSLIFGMYMRTLGHVVTDNGGWRRISHISQNQTPFLSVFDFNHIGKAENESLMETGGQHRPSEQLKTELRALPTQETGSFRFYIGEDTEDGMELNKEVLSILKDESAAEHYHVSGLPSFTRLSCQWNSQSRLVAWRSMSYGTSFGTIGFDNSLSDISLWFLASLMRFSKSVCVAKDDRGCFSGKACDGTVLIDFLTIFSLHNSINWDYRPGPNLPERFDQGRSGRSLSSQTGRYSSTPHTFL
jgi:hypothetical protein